MKRFCYYGVKFVLWLVFRLGFGLEVRGQEHLPATGPFVVASNHISYLDPPVLGVASPRRLTFMARANLFDAPLLGAFLWAVGVIPLQRGTTDVGGLRDAIHRLRRGAAIAIFPEGGRQLSGQLGAAKRGVGLLAAAARVPIIPALVQGTFQALPPGSRRLHRAKIRVVFGKPVAYTEGTSPRPALMGSGAERTHAAHEHHARLAKTVTYAWQRLLEDSR